MIENIDEIKELKELFLKSKKIVVLTGAGISTESGIPTFRDKDTGFWSNMNPMVHATRAGYYNDPELVFGWYEYRRKKIQSIQPNLGHIILKDLEQFHDISIVTQNIDDLHERAGSSDITHLHGSIHQHKCIQCEDPFDINSVILEVNKEDDNLISPPICSCGGMIRPSVVWFFENLPEKELQFAEDISGKCDLFLIVGTSGLVWPAAGLPGIAHSFDIPIIQINPNETGFDKISKYNIKGFSGEILPELYSYIYGEKDENI